MPWQMKSTLIIKFSYLKMPRHARKCKVLRWFPAFVFYFNIYTIAAYLGLSRHIVYSKSSKNVVKIQGSYYSCSQQGVFTFSISVFKGVHFQTASVHFYLRGVHHLTIILLVPTKNAFS